MYGGTEENHKKLTIINRDRKYYICSNFLDERVEKTNERLKGDGPECSRDKFCEGNTAALLLSTGL
jgi:hypothetical protein